MRNSEWLKKADIVSSGGGRVVGDSDAMANLAESLRAELVFVGEDLWQGASHALFGLFGIGSTGTTWCLFEEEGDGKKK